MAKEKLDTLKALIIAETYIHAEKDKFEELSRLMAVYEASNKPEDWVALNNKINTEGTNEIKAARDAFIAASPPSPTAPIPPPPPPPPPPTFNLTIGGAANKDKENDFVKKLKTIFKPEEGYQIQNENKNAIITKKNAKMKVIAEPNQMIVHGATNDEKFIVDCLKAAKELYGNDLVLFSDNKAHQDFVSQIAEKHKTELGITFKIVSKQEELKKEEQQIELSIEKKEASAASNYSPLPINIPPPVAESQYQPIPKSIPPEGIEHVEKGLLSEILSGKYPFDFKITDNTGSKEIEAISENAKNIMGKINDAIQTVEAGTLTREGNKITIDQAKIDQILSSTHHQNLSPPIQN